MTRKRTIGTMAALGGLTAAVALLSGQPAAQGRRTVGFAGQPGAYPAAASTSWRNPATSAPAPSVWRRRAGGPVGVQMMGGSFPRSFLIPGTDTSIRVGGEIRMLGIYWISGGNPNGSSATTNAGTTGQLNNIPLSGHALGSTQAIAAGAATTSSPCRRSSRN